MSSGPDHVIYGVYEPHDSFAVFEADNARALAAEYGAIWACRTKDELLALLPSLELTFRDYEAEDFDDVEDSPLDFSTLPGAADGDWPPMVTANVLQVIDETGPLWAHLRDEAVVFVEDTTLKGEYVRIPLDQEAPFVAVLAHHGITATRDDALIRTFDLP